MIVRCYLMVDKIKYEPSTWNELSGLVINEYFQLPSDSYTEAVIYGQLPNGQWLSWHLVKPKSGTLRQDAGFYYTPSVNCGGGAVIAASGQLKVYKPYFAGQEIDSFDSLRLFVR